MAEPRCLDCGSDLAVSPGSFGNYYYFTCRSCGERFWKQKGKYGEGIDNGNPLERIKDDKEISSSATG